MIATKTKMNIFWKKILQCGVPFLDALNSKILSKYIVDFNLCGKQCILQAN